MLLTMIMMMKVCSKLPGVNDDKNFFIHPMVYSPCRAAITSEEPCQLFRWNWAVDVLAVLRIIIDNAHYFYSYDLAYI